MKPKNKAAVALGSLGGKARKAKLTEAELSESGRKAAEARWKDHKKRKRKEKAVV